MSTAWVAGVVRAKALARRRVGAAGARALAASPGLDDALAALTASPYGHDVRPGQALAEAQHAVGASLLWNMRVLAGWVPRGGAVVVRVLAAGFEVANLDEHLARLHEMPGEPAYRLGTLETAWTRLSGTQTIAGVEQVLGASSWGLRGCRTRREIQLGLRLAWADALMAAVPEAAAWARGGAALLVIREVLLEGRILTQPLARRAAYVLGPAFVDAVTAPRSDLSAVRAGLPGDTRPLLDGVTDVQGLWRAETNWCLGIEHDGFGLLRGSGYGQGPVVGALAVLAVDAWRVRAALEAAARGGAGSALEAFDGVA